MMIDDGYKMGIDEKWFAWFPVRLGNEHEGPLVVGEYVTRRRVYTGWGRKVFVYAQYPRAMGQLWAEYRRLQSTSG